MKQAEEERKRAARLRTPGAFEKIIEEGKKLSTIDVFEGFRCVCAWVGLGLSRGRTADCIL